MSNNPVTSISARNRGTTRFLTGSTPRTCNASSSSRILRAPRSAVIAVPATPASTIASTNGANSRMLARTKNPPRRSSAPNNTRKFAACSPGAPYPKATVETNSGNQHSFNANRNWPTNSLPYGYGGLRADMIVLPVRIIMSPTSSSRFLTGKNPRSATLRTTWSPPLRGRPDEAYATGARAANRQPFAVDRMRSCAQAFAPWYVPARDGDGSPRDSSRCGACARCGRVRRRRAPGQERAVGHLRRARRQRELPRGAAHRRSVAHAHRRAQHGLEGDPERGGHGPRLHAARHAAGAGGPQPADLDRGPR